MCDNFTDINKEYVSVWYVTERFEKKSRDAIKYQEVVDYYEKAGIVGASRHLDEMLTLDYLIANTDRHLGNFGLLRDSNTLEYVGVAPIFDNGNSLWHDTGDLILYVKAKPFSTRHDKQIELVRDLSWFEPVDKKNY